jgi:hypothetical protein
MNGDFEGRRYAIFKLAPLRTEYPSQDSILKHGNTSITAFLRSSYLLLLLLLLIYFDLLHEKRRNIRRGSD